jgi:hypothetical protein
MASMPIRNPIVPPSAILGQPNGAVPEHLLGVVDRDSYIWKMAALPARGMRALHGDVYAKFGVWLSSTGRGRSFQTQYATFLSRHRPITLAEYNKLPNSANYRRYWPQAVSVYKLPSNYWALIKGNAAAAVPGTSPHGMWCADDICLPGNVGIGARPDILQWLYVHEMDYGFAHSLTSEPWHLQWIAGDRVPTAVLFFENVTSQPGPVIPTPTPGPVTPPPVYPPPVITPLEEEDEMPAIRISSAGKPDGLYIVDGTGATFIGLSSLDDANKLQLALGARETGPLSEAQYNELVKVARVGDA